MSDQRPVLEKDELDTVHRLSQEECRFAERG